MNRPSRTLPAEAPRKLSRDTVTLVGDLLPLCDFAGVLLAATFATLLYRELFGAGPVVAALLADGARAAVAAAILAPLILCDRVFVSYASAGEVHTLARCYALRFLMFAAVVAAIGLASPALERLPGPWLALWLSGSLLVTALVRSLLVAGLRRLERRGVLAETIAVVGSGPAAQRLVRQLRLEHGHRVDVVGLFDDRALPAPGRRNAARGSIADLLEFGKSQHLDWILLALPPADADRLPAIVHRLKALAVPIALCPRVPPLAAAVISQDGSSAPGAAAAPDAWESRPASAEAVLPRWILTLLGLPLSAWRELRGPGAGAGAGSGAPRAPTASLACRLDDYDLETFTELARGFGQARYGYVVTPNADHLIRLHREPSFRALYADAAYVLLDSRFIAKLLSLTRGLHLPVCTGSDLTARLLGSVVQPDDGLVLVGASAAQAAQLRERYGLRRLAHLNPPMGFIRDPQAVETCLRFIEAHSPFRYCLIAVGAPQQEMIAQALKARGIARGMGLCVGASIDFLTGQERRAPLWMQRSGLEWLFRLLQAPGRMAGRYLVRGPQVFGLLRRTDILLRPATQPRPALARSA